LDLNTPLKIGTFTLNSRVLQSPLSGVTDLVFRRLVRRYAPDSMMYTEMVQASSLQHLKEVPRIMEIDPNEHKIILLASFSP
jgi:tRNA-dihydrouridine synthase B